MTSILPQPFDSLPIGLKFGAGSAQDYLVLDSILGITEREYVTYDFQLETSGSRALYPTKHRYMSVVRLLRPSESRTATLFAVKSRMVNWFGLQVRHGLLGNNLLPHEIRILNLIWKGTRLWRQRSSTFFQDFLHPNRGKQHIVELFDTFLHARVNVIPRQCAVFELLGPSLSEIRTARELEIGVVKEATRQVLLALDFLHTQCGILYLGLDTASVLVKFATEQEAFDFYLHKDFDALDLSSIHVKLTGFDCAELIDNGPISDDDGWARDWGPMREWEILRVSAAPEVDPPKYYPNFRYFCQLDPEGSSADVWSLGFFVWELLTGEIDLFHPDTEPPPNDYMFKHGDWNAYGIRRSLNFLKFVTESSYPPLPLDYQVDHPEYELNDHPEILYNFPDALRTDQGWSMRERLVAHEVIHDGEVDQVVAVLRGCFQADPSRRLTARQLLENEWMREELKA